MFSAIHIEDKSLSKEEFLTAFAAFGHQSIANANAYFNAFNPEDDLIEFPYRIVADSWVDFLTSTDKSKGNMIKNGFNVYGF